MRGHLVHKLLAAAVVAALLGALAAVPSVRAQTKAVGEVASGMSGLADQLDRLAGELEAGAEAGAALGAANPALEAGLARLAGPQAAIEAAIASGKLTPEQVDEGISGARQRLQEASARLDRAALDLAPVAVPANSTVPELPYPDIPDTPDELQPVAQVLTPMWEETAGRACAGTGGVLALGVIVVAAVAGDATSDVPSEVPLDASTEAVVGLRNVMMVHNLGCRRLPIRYEETRCSSDEDISTTIGANIDEDTRERIALAGEPENYIPAPVGGAVDTMREVERLGDQEGAASEELGAQFDCETVDVRDRFGDAGADLGDDDFDLGAAPNDSPAGDPLPAPTDELSGEPDDAPAERGADPAPASFSGPTSAGLASPGPAPAAVGSSVEPAPSAVPAPTSSGGSSGTAGGELAFDAPTTPVSSGGSTSPLHYIAIAVLLALLGGTYIMPKATGTGRHSA